MLVSQLSQLQMDKNGICIRPRNKKHRGNVRLKANQARQNRATTVLCVLEHPKFFNNIASVLRNVHCLGVSKLYIVSNKFTATAQFHSAAMTEHSASANLWTYIHVFETASQCLDYLGSRNYVSFATTPRTDEGHHIAELGDVPWQTFSKIALWFGNEVTGLAESTLQMIPWWIRVPMGGIVQSLNLASCSAIVLYHVVDVRRGNKSQRRAVKT